MAACKAAIKAYRPLAAEEIQQILADLAAAEDPRTCPHGRPTTLCFSLEEVDRRFGRKG
jgi:DNA mismatch repair protein MutL